MIQKKGSLTHCGTKGEIISKGHFGVFNSSKKQTKNFWPSRLGQKSKFSSSFFGRIEDTKISFWDYLTFTQAWLPTIIQGQNYCVHSRGLFCIQLCWVFLNKNGWSLGVCSMLLKGSFCSLLHIVGVCVKVIYPKYSKH